MINLQKVIEFKAQEKGPVCVWNCRKKLKIIKSGKIACEVMYE